MTVSVLEKKGKPERCFWKNQQETFIASLIDSKNPDWIPQSAFPKQMWCVAPVKLLLLGCSGAWSEVWTKLQLGQTNSCLAQGRGHVKGEGRAHPCLPHTPDHPTPLCHFTSDPIHSLHPSFMFTLTSLPFCHPHWGRWCSIMAGTKHLNVQVVFPCFCNAFLVLLNVISYIILVMSCLKILFRLGAKTSVTRICLNGP